MAKIKSLQLHNYKFFDTQEPIVLNENHLLLYGENGSGKSSIYWSLHTLFESSLKQSEEIKKYFLHSTVSEESLVNIYADSIIEDDLEHYNSFVEVITDEETDNSYKVSLKDLTINENLKAEEINKASDFIDYKVLYRFQDFWNGEPMNLAKIFIGSFLPFIEFTGNEIIRGGVTKTVTNGFKMWEEINKGPGTTINNKGKKIQVYKNSRENIKFNQFLSNFNDNLKDLIDFINVNAPDILYKLGYDITFQLKYSEPICTKADVNYNCEPFEIEFKLNCYLGRDVTVHRPQSFLNEAKMTAIAIAIRLTVLKKRINERAPNVLKFIVFDDVMISLDMNNRDKLIDYILDKENGFIDDYQLLFLTHDRSFFYYLKDKIRNAGLINKWIYKEMYVNSEPNKETPSIYDYPNKIEKAEYYLQIHDYPACGIYLRTLCEELLNNLYPDTKKYTIGNNNEGLCEHQTINLNHKINHFESFCKEESIDYEDFKDLKTYKSVILNSLAHYDISSPIYKTELIKIKNVLEKLSLYSRNTQIAKPNATFTIEFTKADGFLYTLGITIKDQLKILDKKDDFKRLSNLCKVNITFINDNGVETKDINIEKTSIKEIVSETCIQLGIENNLEIEEALKDRNKKTIKELIDEL